MEDKDLTPANNETDTISAETASNQGAVESAVTEDTPANTSAPIETPHADVPEAAHNEVATAVPVTANTPESKKGRAKWLLPIIIVGTIVAMAASTYGYMGVYLQSPQNLWSQALKNTGEAINDYATGPKQTYSGAKISGTYNVISPTAVDGTITAAFDGKSTSATITANAMGIMANLEVLSITKQPASSPDIYLKLSGVKGAATLLGNNKLAEVVSKLDGQWYYIDHTLTANLTKNLPNTANDPQQLQANVQDAAKKVSTVLQDRLFNSDSKKAVLVTAKTLGKEDFKGRKTQKYQAQLRKTQLKDMVTELQSALKDSKLSNSIFGDINDANKQQENQNKLDKILKQIEALPEEKLTAEVWVDTGLKYIRNVRIALPGNNASTATMLDIMVDYTGGDTMPIIVTQTNSDAKNNSTTTLGVTANKSNSAVELSFAQKGNTGGQNMDFSSKIKVDPSNDSVNAAVPAGAKNIMELSGGVLGANTQDPSAGQQGSFLDQLMQQ